MPGARRTRKGQTKVNPDAQIKQGSGSGKPDSYDGRANTNAGSQPGTAGSRGELDVQRAAKVIQTT